MPYYSEIYIDLVRLRSVLVNRYLRLDFPPSARVTIAWVMIVSAQAGTWLFFLCDVVNFLIKTLFFISFDKHLHNLIWYHRIGTIYHRLG